ncbi:MAG: PEGA domain-containing protein [Acidobacteria bacterium]|nr:PEGA domain-containing protein [Acidobacteriota bacterium]
MRSNLLLMLLWAGAGLAQIVVPEGTKIRVRLDQTISSATAEEGQTVELTATDAVRIGDVVVVPEGARVTGTITEARSKRRMGRAGKMDFSIDRVKTSDNQWVQLRYTVTKKSGESHAVRTGVITAGVAAVFWPAAPVFLLMKGKDITINKGVTFDVYTDVNHTLNASTSPTVPPSGTGAQAVASVPGTATVIITSSVAGADIELDGGFVGSTPATLQIPAGIHRISVRSGLKVWQRTVQVTAGSSIPLSARLE